MSPAVRRSYQSLKHDRKSREEFFVMSLTAEFAGIDHDAAVEAYDRDGVIRVRGLLSPEAVAAVRAVLGRYTREIAPTLPSSDVMFEADGDPLPKS